MEELQKRWPKKTTNQTKKQNSPSLRATSVAFHVSHVDAMFISCPLSGCCAVLCPCTFSKADLATPEKLFYYLELRTSRVENVSLYNHVAARLCKLKFNKNHNKILLSDYTRFKKTNEQNNAYLNATGAARSFLASFLQFSTPFSFFDI